MLFVLLICSLAVASVANPFHKYPFVFLLDVGNEELDKTNTEQIRVSVPGGSLAVRYPAINDGDLITHVRVSGIDFGTDLKANIIDGGPGYKYVVLVFLGNTGIPYDAVVTLQTVPGNMDAGTNDQSSISSTRKDHSNVYQTSDESNMNNSAEEIDDGLEKIVNNESDAETAQPSSNVYNYARVVEDEDDVISDETENIHAGYNENEVQHTEENLDDCDGIKSNDDKNEDTEANQYRAEKLEAESNDVYAYNGKYNNNNKLLESDTSDQVVSLDEDAKMYRQDTLYDAQGHDNVYSSDDLVELDQMFNDEEVHNDADKYKDSNNNNFDSDYESAVAY